MSKTDYGSNYFKDRRFSRNEKSYQDDLNFLRKYIDPSLSILDYGCGEMRFTHFLKDYFSNVSVYDISSYIQSLDAYNNIFNPDFSSCKYDVIVLRGVLQHLDQPFSVLSDLISKKLKPNGYIVFLSTPNTLSPYYLLNKTLPPLDKRLNYWVSSEHEISQVMNYRYNCDLVAKYFPYLSSGYANILRDHTLFILNIFGIRSRYPFWYSMCNLIYRIR